MRSVTQNTRHANKIHFWIGTTHEAVNELRGYFNNFKVLESLNNAQVTVLDIQEISENLKSNGYTPLWMWKEYGASVADPTNWGNTSWSVHPIKNEVTVDNKHMHPMNLIRMYMGRMKELTNVKKVIFMDDDIIVQKDIINLYKVKMMHDSNTVVSANCHKWYRKWKTVDGNHTFFQWRYDAKGTPAVDNLFLRFEGNDNDDRKTDMLNRLNSVAQEISKNEGLSKPAMVESVNYFNFGLTLVDLDNWRKERVTEQYQKWVEVNYKKRWFSETSLQFGLGLPFLGLLGKVQCHPDNIDIVDGCGWVSSSKMAKVGLTKLKLENSFCLHYNGKDKPWDASSKLDNVFQMPWMNAQMHIPAATAILGKSYKYRDAGSARKPLGRRAGRRGRSFFGKVND